MRKGRTTYKPFCRLLKIFMAAVFIMFTVPCLAVATQASRSPLKDVFGLQITFENSGYSYTVRCWQPQTPQEKVYYITLPARENNTVLAAEFPLGDVCVLNGQTLNSGDTVSLDSTNTLLYNGSEYTLLAVYTGNLPSVHITTETGSFDRLYADKLYKELGYADILLNGEKIYSGELDHIKTRGNSTWDREKRGFNIKFSERKDLFGMGKAKKWCLVANYDDLTLVRNMFAYQLAEKVGLEYTSQMQPVDLYINDTYMGCYMLTEAVETGTSRVNIRNLEEETEWLNSKLKGTQQEGAYGADDALVLGSRKWVDIPNNPDDITGGYIIENQLVARYDDETCGFVTDYGQTIALTSPEYASEKQVNYIADYYQEFEDAVISETGFNSLGKHYSDYIDVESFARMYLLQEYTKNVDAGTTSSYIYKDAGGKMYAGPAWDFDFALGFVHNRYYIALDDPSTFWVTNGRMQYKDYEDKKTIFGLLTQHVEFRKLAAEIWQRDFLPHLTDVEADLDGMVASIWDSAIVERTRWNRDTVRTAAETVEWYTENIDILKSFVTRRTDFMNIAFDTSKYYVLYSANGGQGKYIDLSIYAAGETAVVRENPFTNGNRAFLYWNTAPDGSGVSYAIWQEITVEGDITLYAQWRPLSFVDRLKQFILNIYTNSNIL